MTFEIKISLAVIYVTIYAPKKTSRSALKQI